MMLTSLRRFTLLVLLLVTLPAVGAGAIEGEVRRQPLNQTAILMFLLFVVATLFITWRASSSQALALSSGVTDSWNTLRYKPCRSPRASTRGKCLVMLKKLIASVALGAVVLSAFGEGRPPPSPVEPTGVIETLSRALPL